MKNLLNLGRALNKVEQRAINGGIDKCGTPCEAGTPRCRLCNGSYMKQFTKPTHGFD